MELEFFFSTFSTLRLILCFKLPCHIMDFRFDKTLLGIFQAQCVRTPNNIHLRIIDTDNKKENDI